jgi:hypothetical protein
MTTGPKSNTKPPPPWALGALTPRR